MFNLSFGTGHCTFSEILLNPFVPNAPFLYPLRFSDVFRGGGGVEKGCIGNEWVNPFHPTDLSLYIY